MADWNKPDLQSQYTEVLTEIDERLEDSAKLFDGVTTTNIPDGTKRWNPSNQLFEEWDETGSAWGPLILSVDGGGTGADNAADSRTNLGLGSAATRNVGTSTNAQIPDRGQADTRYGRKTVNESISGTWNFTNGLQVSGNTIASAAFRDIGTSSGNVMEVGAFSGPTGSESFYHTGNLNPLEDSDLAANGGNITTEDFSNTFTAQQLIETDGGALSIRTPDVDGHELPLFAQDVASTTSWLQSNVSGNRILRYRKGGGAGTNNLRAMAWTNFDTDTVFTIDLSQAAVAQGEPTGGFITNALNAEALYENGNRVATLEGNTFLAPQRIETDTQLILRSGDGGDEFRVRTNGFNKLEIINWASGASIDLLGATGDFRLNDGALLANNGAEVSSLQIGGGATITKTLKASASLPSGTWSVNQEVMDVSVSGANVGDTAIVNARASADPTNEALAIVGSVVRSGVVQVKAVGSVGSDGSENVEVLVFQN